MTTDPQPHTRWVTLWATLVLLSSLANIGAWVWHLGGVVRVASNVAWLFGLPGWVPLYALGMRGIRDHPGGIIAANAIAWACWLAGLAVVLAVRRYLHRSDESTRPEPGEPDLSRRRFLANAGAGSLGVGFVGAPVYGACIEPGMLRTRRYSIAIDGLPAALDGLRVVQFADPHLGPRVPAATIEAAVAAAIELAPDLVVLNGDYVADGTREIERVASLIEPLADAAAIGAVGVLGNHDWWANGPLVRDAMRARGVRMIDNHRLWIDAGSKRLSQTPVREGLAVVGLGDLTEDDTDLGRAFGGVGGSTPRLVVTHQPDTAELEELGAEHGPRMDLMLCGHTHGGQVRIPLVGTPLIPSEHGQKYAGGLVSGPSCPVIVSRGIGMSLLPVRVGVPPEISLITLTRG